MRERERERERETANMPDGWATSGDSAIGFGLGRMGDTLGVRDDLFDALIIIMMSKISSSTVFIT